jgi:hypothetical protein
MRRSRGEMIRNYGASRVVVASNMRRRQNIHQHFAADNRSRGRYLGLRCRAPRAMCELRKNELLKDTGQRRLTKSD